MCNFFRILFCSLTIIIITIVISVIILIRLVDPNDYKNRIDQFIYNKTGYHLILKSNTGWSFLPWLERVNLKKQVKLNNP